MALYSQYSHRCPIEVPRTKYFEVHRNHRDWDFYDLIDYILGFNRRKQDVTTLITGKKTGTGKSVLALWLCQALYQAHHPGEWWPWREWTAFYDWQGEFLPFRRRRTGRWEVVMGDEAFEGMFGRDTQMKSQKIQMKDFGTGRCLMKDNVICGPAFKYVDIMMREFYVDVWIHLPRQGFAKIRVRCPVIDNTVERALFDCYGEVTFKLPVPASFLSVYERVKDAKKREWEGRAT
jgi:hypothetical protein